MTTIVVLRLVRWSKLRASTREFGAVEVTEVVQVNPIAEAHAVQVPLDATQQVLSDAAEVETAERFVSTVAPSQVGEKDGRLASGTMPDGP